MLTLEETIEEQKKQYRLADRALNTEYKKLYAGMDGAGREKLMKAQRAWIAFRDANAMLRGDSMRGKAPASATGKGGELLLYTALREMTEVRATELAAIRQERESARKP
ncbi:MAG: DUF1311 domain-containing protein [Fibrella sp.]|nr:DUF1311 domain-containing protein [Armatimonadota bacterium]